jgi:hypothetical protein
MRNAVKILSVVLGVGALCDASANINVSKAKEKFLGLFNKAKNFVNQHQDNAAMGALVNLGSVAANVGTVVVTQKLQGVVSNQIQPYINNVISGANGLLQKINGEVTNLRNQESQIQKQEIAINNQAQAAIQAQPQNQAQIQVKMQQDITQLEIQKQQLASIDAAYVKVDQDLRNLVALVQCGDLQRIVNETPVLINQIQATLANTPLKDEAINLATQAVSHLTNEAANEINNKSAAISQQYLAK